MIKRKTRDLMKGLKGYRKDYPAIQFQAGRKALASKHRRMRGSTAETASNWRKYIRSFRHSQG